MLRLTRENSCCKFWGWAGVVGTGRLSAVLSFCLTGVAGGELGAPGSVSRALANDAVSWESNISSSPSKIWPQAWKKKFSDWIIHFTQFSCYRSYTIFML